VTVSLTDVAALRQKKEKHDNDLLIINYSLLCAIATDFSSVLCCVVYVVYHVGLIIAAGIVHLLQLVAELATSW